MSEILTLSTVYSLHILLFAFAYRNYSRDVFSAPYVDNRKKNVCVVDSSPIPINEFPLNNWFFLYIAVIFVAWWMNINFILFSLCVKLVYCSMEILKKRRWVTKKLEIKTIITTQLNGHYTINSIRNMKRWKTWSINSIH